MVHILVNSGLVKQARPLVDALRNGHCAENDTEMFEVLMEGSELSCSDQSNISSFILEYYLSKGLVNECLEVFRKITSNGYWQNVMHGDNGNVINSCVMLCKVLEVKGEGRMTLCICGAMVRYGVMFDEFMMSMVCRIFCKEEKVDNARKLLKSGCCSCGELYELVIDSYCKKGKLEEAVEVLGCMLSKRMSPGFSVYGSLLDSACRIKDIKFVERIVREMVKKGFTAESRVVDYNSAIEKLCNAGKSYAAEMFFQRALVEKIHVQYGLYGCMLLALCQEARVKEAMHMYKMVVEMGIKVDDSCYSAFVNIICNQKPSLELDIVLTKFVIRGFVPCTENLSKYIRAHCDHGRWKHAESLLYIVMENGIMPDSASCCYLVQHYCLNKQIDIALQFHENMEKLGGKLDVITYNGLLIALFKKRKIEEVIRVFDYMRKHNVGSGVTYSIIILGLCHEKEMRKAMKYHEEMLELQLKPNKSTYKRILGMICK